MRFYQVDAFTQTPYEGNPCAVFPEAGELTDSQMLAIAREMNLSETAFAMPSQRADFRARYFMPMGEIPLAGHPTIATIYVMLREGLIGPVPPGEALELTLELPAGVITVRVIERDRRPWITMRQLLPEFLRSYDRAGVAAALGLRPEDLRQDVPVQTVSTGTPQLMVPVAAEEALNRARIVPSLYEPLAARGDFFSPHLFVLYNEGGIYSTRARHFGGVDLTSEDPFTGSASGGMTAYLYKHELMADTELTALQGASVGRPGIATCRVIPDASAENGIGAVEITGTAVSVFTGELETVPPV